MKVFIIGILSVFLAVAGDAALAQKQEDALANAFQRGNTYIRYHLNPDALESHNDANTTFTLTHRTINAIDAYFECIPDIVPDTSLSEPRYFEVRWEPAAPEQPQYALPSPSADASGSFPLMAFWNVGNLAVSLGYDEFVGTTTASAQWMSPPNRQALAGQLSLPLGETGFSFGASLIMKAVEMQARAFTESVQPAQPLPFDITADVPVHLGYAVADGNASLPEHAESPMALFGKRNTVAGAVNVSGTVKGFNVFTEVGFASGTEEYDGQCLPGDVTASNFYAAGGANYTVGQVTLGFEAGFENGEELMEGDGSLGFEHDFLIENLLPETQFERQADADKVYASVSAKLSPTERMTIGGAFTHVQPLGGSVESYGFEVDGAFYYSLTNYLKYLAKAGMSTLYNSLEESQYRFINSLELTF
jgi:hypothetical protein